MATALAAVDLEGIAAEFQKRGVRAVRERFVSADGKGCCGLIMLALRGVTEPVVPIDLVGFVRNGDPDVIEADLLRFRIAEALGVSAAWCAGFQLGWDGLPRMGIDPEFIRGYADGEHGWALAIAAGVAEGCEVAA